MNKASKTFIANGGAKRFKFFARTFGDKFDAAIGQIFNSAADFKTGGERFHGIAKTDALHATGIKNFQAAAICRWRAGWWMNSHGRMKPKSAAARNVFCRASHFFTFF